MALTPTPVCVQVPKTDTLTLSGSTYVANTVNAFVIAGANGNKAVAVSAVNTDSAAHILQLWNQSGILASFSVPANSGNDGATATGNVMSLWAGLPRDNDGQVYFFVEPNATLGLSMTTTMPAGKFMYASIVHAQF